MFTISGYPVRTGAALLALTAILAYGPSPAALAEPASPGESRIIAGTGDRDKDRNAPSLPGPSDEDARVEAAPDASGGPGAGVVGAEESLEKEAPKGNVEPPSKKLKLTVPRLGLEDVKVGDSPDQAYLDREGIMHLSGTGFPYQKGSNTYIAAHAIGYDYSRVTYAFQDLQEMKKGDRVSVRDAAGKTYKYRVYEKMIVDPSDTWVTKPVEGKKIISLQTCWPAPSFEKRLIVRAELVK